MDNVLIYQCASMPIKRMVAQQIIILVYYLIGTFF